MAIGFGYRNYLKGAAGLGAVAYQTRNPAFIGRRSRTGRSYTLVTTNKRRQAFKGNSFKRQVMKLHPAKHYTMETSPNNTHNTILSMCPTQGITQGDGNTNRDGDGVHLESIKVKGTLITSAAAGAYQHRIIVGWSGEEITTANIATSLVSGLSATELFLPTTAGTWVNDGIINPKAFTCLYDETFDLNSQIALTQDLVSIGFTVPIHQDFDYQASGSVMGKTKNLFVVVIAAVAGGVTGTTAAGQHLISADLIFKNT